MPPRDVDRYRRAAKRRRQLPFGNLSERLAQYPVDEVDDPTALQLETRVNDRVMQTGCLDELIFDIPALVEYCSTFTELLPGDVIATGTPGGVGAARKHYERGKKRLRELLEQSGDE